MRLAADVAGPTLFKLATSLAALTMWCFELVDGDVAPGDTSGNRSLRLLRAGQ